jgi:uncharacterized protein (TIGR02145 family)
MKKGKLLLSFALMSAIVLTGYSQDFKEVKIGNQIWMTENLNVDKFRNGDTIQQVKDATAWKIAGEKRQPAWCYYKNDPANGTKYGKLYNWFAVSDPRGLAPKGWHIPMEWGPLTDYLGGEYAAGMQLKSTSGWYDNGNGKNKSGFNGLPAGNRDYKGVFSGIGDLAYWWSSINQGSLAADIRMLSYRHAKITKGVTNMADGISVRCIKD